MCWINFSFVQNRTNPRCDSVFLFNHVSFPREYDSLFKVYPYSRVFLCSIVKQRNGSLGNVAWKWENIECNEWSMWKKKS